MSRHVIAKQRRWGAQAWLAASMAGLSAAAFSRRRRRLSLRGRVAVVTGGARGLGLAITRALLEGGCHVAICGRDGEVVRRCVDQYRAEGFAISGQACDVSNPDQVKAFLQLVVDTHGPVDILVNNAAQCYVGPAPELDSLDMQLALQNIFWGQFHTTMAVLPQMRARRFGRIVNITSLGGKLPIPHQAAYVAAKHAATGWSETLAAELEHEGVVVSTITPPPLRNGAPLHAHYNGQRDREFTWFANALTSPLSAISADRVARAVVQAIVRGQHERAVSPLSWFVARAHGLAPNVVGIGLRWLARRMPPAGGPGLPSTMRLGADVARSSADTSLLQLARRVASDEARYLPEGSAQALAGTAPVVCDGQGTSWPDSAVPSA